MAWHTRTPPPDIEIDESLVRQLLRQQRPHWADLPLQLIDAGWDNVMYRFGTDLTVRLPRRKIAAALIGHEQRWLPVLSARLPLATPDPVYLGRPSDRYPWTWTVARWLPGVTADQLPPGNDQAVIWAEFLRALHQPAAIDAPFNPARSVSLSDCDAALRQRFHQLSGRTRLITAEIRRAWAETSAIPPSGQRIWIHGDLHSRNVLVQAGRISGVIDWGDVAAGDPATDLASVWMLFEEKAARQRCLSEYQADAELEHRALGWAIYFGTVLLDTGLVDHPAHAQMGASILRRVAER